MTKNKRIAVGHGKYCYSGPDCRIHGNQAQTSSQQPTSLPTNLTEFSPEDFTRQVAQTHKEMICKFPVVPTFESLKSDAFEKKQNVHYCEEHNGYHVYPHDESPHKNLLKLLHKTVGQAAADGTTPPERIAELRETVNRINSKTLHPEYAKDFNITNKLRSAYEQTAEGKEQFIQRLSGASNKLIQKKPEKPLSKAMPKFPSSKLSEEQLLEFWVCGRKTQYDTPQAASKKFQEYQVADGMTYQCERCHKYHAAHRQQGTETRDSRRIKIAEMFWNKYPEKADRYAFKKGLI